MPLSPTRLPSPYGSDRLVRLAARLRPALCDTMITVGSQEFPAHSLVLAGVSQQLGRRGHWTLVKGISPSTFAQLLYFVYGESVELQPGELGPLEEAARALGVQSLEEACRKARRDRARAEFSQGLKEHQKPEKPTRDSESGVGDLGEQRPEKFIRAGGREQEMVQEHRPLRESSEIAEATPEDQREHMRSEEKLDQSLFGHGGVGREQEVIMWVKESPGDSEESLGKLPGPPPPPGSLQTSSITSRPWWAEAPWLRESQPALWSLLLLPPRYGTPFSHSTSISAAWQEVWPQDQRIPLSLNLHKGLRSQNQLAFSSSTSGSLPQGPANLSPGEMEESDQRHTGALATCVDHVGKAGCPSRQQPFRPPPARSRPYSCSVCGKRFSLKHQMETHYRVHTGEKPFSCGLCPQRSRDFSAMTKHLRTHGAAPYRCSLCGAGCPSLASMQAHMRGHSPSQLPPGWTIRSTFLYSSSASTSSRPSWDSTSK
ncbi:zinc finger and BTB domain-containing protein 32 [Myotis yumanensis]|uniref:zinc finger and BTB domain-containing protein 32 n=1 Tax=Myotis yumanensis TaxID=159337 RepID=UPI0038D3CC41